MTRVRVALTISGAVALGAYEGGALAALLVAAQALISKDPTAPALRFDVMGGASAGSITALLAARTLTNGLDPIATMKAAWVDEDSLSSLRTWDTASLLTIERVRDATERFFREDGDRPRQEEVRVRMVLATLRGFGYTIHGLDPVGDGLAEEIDATTFVDWKDFKVSHDMAVDELIGRTGRSAVDVALASGATPFAFPAVSIDRGPDRENYRRIDNFPASGWLWYTDGGIIDNQPLRRTAALAAEIDDPAGGLAEHGERRLHVLINPHPTSAPGGTQFADPTDRPSFTTTLARAVEVATSQSLYADVREIVRENSRIAWARKLRDELAAAIEQMTGPDAELMRRTLATVLEQIEKDRASLDGQAPDPVGAAAVDANRLVASMLDQILERVADRHRRDPIAISVISPQMGTDDPPVEKKLAGEFAFHFGGFLQRSLRASDFSLGYDNALAWMESRLAGYGLAEADVEPALAAVREHRSEAHSPNLGGATFDSLDRGSKLGIVPVLVQLLRVLVHDIRHRRRG